MAIDTKKRLKGLYFSPDTIEMLEDEAEKTKLKDSWVAEELIREGLARRAATRLEVVASPAMKEASLAAMQEKVSPELETIKALLMRLIVECGGTRNFVHAHAVHALGADEETGNPFAWAYMKEAMEMAGSSLANMKDNE